MNEEEKKTLREILQMLWQICTVDIAQYHLKIPIHEEDIEEYEELLNKLCGKPEDDGKDEI